jgi:peptidoglycan/LPS O-acetylase OafA/YrhL
VKSSNTRYLVGIDHLRGLAALLIVFYHGLHLLSFGTRAAGTDPTRLWIFTKNPFVALIEEGHTSVALFMVLSGFVFTAGAIGKEVAYWPFLKNRFLRIYPLYVVVLFIGFAAAPAQYAGASLLQSLLFQANYPGAVSLGAYSAVFWAVAVEFQFYLLFPFLHRFTETYGARWAVACIAMFILLRTAAATDSANPRDVSYWFILGRLDQFLLGMLAARAFRRLERHRLPWGSLSLASFALMLLVIVTFNQLGGFPAQAWWKVLWPTVEGLGWAAVLLSYASFAGRLPRTLSRVLAGLGTLSYSIYMLHFVCIVSLPRLIPFSAGDRPNLASQLYVATRVLPVLLPLALLSYYVIERPFLNLRVRYLRDPEIGRGAPP